MNTPKLQQRKEKLQQQLKETAGGAGNERDRSPVMAKMGRLFDASYYLGQFVEDEGSIGDPLEHYLSSGAAEGLDPSPFFSTSHYLAMAPDVAEMGINPLEHYVQAGWREQRSFHSRFFNPFYRAQRPMLAEKDDYLTDFIEQGLSEGAVPDPFFDISTAAALYPEIDGTGERWRHYLITGRGRPHDPFPQSELVQRFIALFPSHSVLAYALTQLFDAEYYIRQLRDKAKIEISQADALLHYFKNGVALGLNPHPLFDTSFYLENIGATKASVENPLLKYLLTPPLKRKSPCRFFDVDFYRSQHPEVDWERIDPLCHYLSIGAAHNFQPFSLFDPIYYRAKYLPHDELHEVSPLEDFVKRLSLGDVTIKTFAFFDFDAYLDQHPDLASIADPGFSPLSHFIFHGERELRPPNYLRSEQYVLATQNQTSFNNSTHLEEYLGRRLNYRTRLIFVGHEASRTGAPAILLGLVKHFSKLPGVECISIQDEAGPLVAEFERCSHVFIPKYSRHTVYSPEPKVQEFNAEISQLLECFEDNPPVAAICNSAETRLYGMAFKARGIPVISLIHEIADFYPREQMQLIADASDRIVFPAQFVANTMARACPLIEQQSVILPQGLLRESYGLLPKIGRARVFADLGIEENDFVVTNCGTLDGRKGFDIFVAIARRLRDRYTGDRPIKFVWVGGIPRWKRHQGAMYDSIRYWASWELDWNRLGDMVTVISEVPDTEPYLRHSDVFLLTSRADPFPCVVHEAMACELPVICFENCGGAPEAIGDSGIVVPYQDLDAAADALIALAGDEKRRSSLGRLARQRVRAKYEFAEYAEKMGALVAEISDAPKLSAPSPAKTKGRIFFAMPGWNISGVNTFTEQLVEHLNAAGYHAEIVLTPGRWTHVRWSEKPVPVPDVPYRFLQPPTADRPTWPVEMKRFLLENAPCIFVPNYDYVVSELTPDLPPTVGIIGIVHSDDREHYSHFYKFGRYWNRIVAVSADIQDKMAKLNPIFSEKTELIYYGVKPPEPQVVNEATAARAKQTTPIRLVYAGRFEIFQKRIDDYVELARRLAAAQVPFHMQLIGDGTEFKRVSQALAPFVRAGLVELPGRLGAAETQEAMLQAHCVLVLSDFEGLPLTLVEGMQRGCVPIVYDIKSGIPEVVADGDNGFIVRKSAWDQIMDRITRLQTDPQLWARMSAASTATVERMGLTQDAMGRKYEKIVAEILSEIEDGRYIRPTVL